MLVAQLVRTYGVPVEALDAALAGQMPAAPTAQQQPIDPAAVAQQAEANIMRRLQQQRQAAHGARAQAEAEAFISSGEAEFIEDVRNDVADMLEMAAKRGVALPLKDAYARACQLHPEVSKVLKQREAATQANAAQASTQRARAAASSVRSQPTGSPGASKPEDLHGTIEAAWARASGR
jgi:hypothetical protein